MKTTPVAAGAAVASPKKQRGAAKAATAAPATPFPAALPAAAAPAVPRPSSSKKKRRAREPDVAPPAPPPTGPAAPAVADGGAATAPAPAAPAPAAGEAPPAKKARKANPTPGRVARVAAHEAERATVDGPLFSDPAEFLRAAHARWARNQLPGKAPPAKEVAAVARLHSDRVAGVHAPVPLSDVAAVVAARHPAVGAVQQARHRAAAKVPPTAAAVKVLVLTLSAVKATAFGRHLRALTAAGASPPPAVVKLFSKHIKVEENAAFLEAAAASTAGHVPLAVGTPARVLSLLEAGSLALLRSTVVVVDASRDVKERMVVDGPDTADAFMGILGRYLVPSGCSLFLFRDRGVEVEKAAAEKEAAEKGAAAGKPAAAGKGKGL